METDGSPAEVRLADPRPVQALPMRQVNNAGVCAPGRCLYVYQFCKLKPFLLNRDTNCFPQSKVPLYDLVIHFNDSKYSDPRDKVFSLLSLIPGNEQLALRVAFADDGLTVEEVSVMTLAFLKSFCRRSLTSEDDDLFMALNVGPVPQRERFFNSSKPFERRFAQDFGDGRPCAPSAGQSNDEGRHVASREQLKQDHGIAQVVRDPLGPALGSLATMRRMTTSQKRMAVAAYGACLVSLGASGIMRSQKIGDRDCLIAGVKLKFGTGRMGSFDGATSFVPSSLLLIMFASPPQRLTLEHRAVVLKRTDKR